MSCNPMITDLIGNTPLLYLKRASEETGCHIYGKAEFLNPGGSVKDRTALGIIRAAEASGALRPGGVIVEGTAGNTGIGMTLVANALGYRSVVVMPVTYAREKIERLELYGADLHLVPVTGYEDPNHYIHTARRLAEELSQRHPEGAVFGNQFDNAANRDIHYRTTGQEIWQQTDGQIDAFICAAGTGGTLAGVGKALKEHKPDCLIAIADPQGSALYQHYSGHNLWEESGSIAEGVGISFLTENLQHAPVDKALRIRDETALPYLFDLLRHEGICLGGSSAINIAGAIELAKEMGPGHTLVTVLCDGGDQYRNKLYNPSFLQARGLPAPDWI